MEGKAYLGVDGGGTKTDFLLEASGRKYETSRGTIHPMQVSSQEFLKRLQEGVGEVCKMAGIECSDINFSFIGVPGFGQFKEKEASIRDSVEKVLKSKRFMLSNDYLNAWAGSLNGEAGINLVLGTGSIGYARDDECNEAICGGWGPILGDEASGFYIGKRILNYFTKMSDGRVEKTSLYYLVKEELKIEEDVEIISRVSEMDRGDIASLSKLLQKSLEVNDKIAIQILDDIGKEAALIIDSLYEKLPFKSQVKASYSGGVFELDGYLLGKIEMFLRNDIIIQKPLNSPIEGALILAKKYASS